MIERCQNTLCITVCCLWGCKATHQSGCSHWPLSTAKSANNGHVSIIFGPRSNGRRWPSHGWPCACASLTWGTHGTRMHYGKRAIRWRQCNDLGNVLLWNLGSCYPCGCYFDTYHLLKHCCRSCTPFDGCGLFQQDNAQCHKPKWFRNSLRSTTMSLRCWLGLQISQISIEYLWDVLDKQVQSIEAPSCNFQDLKDLLLTSWCQIPQHLQGSSGVHALTGLSCFGTKRGTTQYLAGGHNVVPDRCTFLLELLPHKCSSSSL